MLFDAFEGPARRAGVDEVGRGALVGPVVAAAVIFDAEVPVGLRDSKRLTAKRRRELAEEIKALARAWAIGWASVAEVDALNVLRASHLAMQRAVAGLAEEPEVVLVDGNVVPRFAVPAVALIGGDDRVPEISAASIVAKVARDAELAGLARAYPGYGLERHKGYATAAHLAALARLGPTPAHRRSFAPVSDAGNRTQRTEPLAW